MKNIYKKYWEFRCGSPGVFELRIVIDTEIGMVKARRALITVAAGAGRRPEPVVEVD